jgi:hypothetical protein
MLKPEAVGGLPLHNQDTVTRTVLGKLMAISKITAAIGLFTRNRHILSRLPSRKNLNVRNASSEQHRQGLCITVRLKIIGRTALVARLAVLPSVLQFLDDTFTYIVASTRTLRSSTPGLHTTPRRGSKPVIDLSARIRWLSFQEPTTVVRHVNTIEHAMCTETIAAFTQIMQYGMNCLRRKVPCLKDVGTPKHRSTAAAAATRVVAIKRKARVSETSANSVLHRRSMNGVRRR